MNPTAADRKTYVMAGSIRKTCDLYRLLADLMAQLFVITARDA